METNLINLTDYQTDDDLRDMSLDQYQLVAELKQNANRSIDILGNKIRKVCTSLEKYPNEQLKKMFEITQDSPLFLYRDIRKSTLTYLNNKDLPIFQSKKIISWSQIEIVKMLNLR